MNRLDEIKERWKYFLGDEWSPWNQEVTGHGAAIFTPLEKRALLIIKRDGHEPGCGIVVGAVPDTAPLVHGAIIHCPQDIKYLLDLLEESHGGSL